MSREERVRQGWMLGGIFTGIAVSVVGGLAYGVAAHNPDMLHSAGHSISQMNTFAKNMMDMITPNTMEKAGLVLASALTAPAVIGAAVGRTIGNLKARAMRCSS